MLRNRPCVAFSHIFNRNDLNKFHIIFLRFLKFP
jgi:hypothetical protein